MVCVKNTRIFVQCLHLKSTSVLGAPWRVLHSFFRLNTPDVIQLGFAISFPTDYSNACTHIDL